MFQNSLEIYTDKGNQCLTMIQSNIFCMTKNEDLFWFLEVKHDLKIETFLISKHYAYSIIHWTVQFI